MAELKVYKRDIFGRRTQQLRDKGLIPAELYGHGVENIHLAVPADQFQRVYEEAGEHSIVNVDVDGDVRPVLIHDVAWDPIADAVLSVDFYQVRMDEKVTAHVPLELVGVSPAVENLGGTLIQVMDEIEVEALPSDLPHKIEVDISKLTELEESIYVRDLPKTDKFEFVAEPDTAVVSVSAPREEEEETEGEIAPEDVIVEGEEKKRAEGDEGSSGSSTSSSSKEE